MGTTKSLELHPVLDSWNALCGAEAAEAILPCCGSQAWAEAVASARPFFDEASLLTASRSVWASLPEAEWQQAFDSHPRIGERKPHGYASETALRWSESEQRAAMDSAEAEKQALQQANTAYEQRFGRIFILSAGGLSATEILAQLDRRLRNDPQNELLEAAREQAHITERRLMRWLEPS